MDGLKYADLQKLAKEHGLKANQKASVLREELRKYMSTSDSTAATSAGHGLSSLLRTDDCKPATQRCQSVQSSSSQDEGATGNCRLSGQSIGLSEEEEPSFLFCDATPEIHSERSTKRSQSSRGDRTSPGNSDAHCAAGHAPCSDSEPSFGDTKSQLQEMDMQEGSACCGKEHLERQRTYDQSESSCNGSGKPCIRRSTFNSDEVAGSNIGESQKRRGTYDKVEGILDNSGEPDKRQRTYDNEEGGLGNIEEPRKRRGTYDKQESSHDKRNDSVKRCGTNDKGGLLCSSGDNLGQRYSKRLSESVRERSAEEAAADEMLLGSMRQDMSDNEMKASLLDALQKKVDGRQDEIADRVARARAVLPSGQSRDTSGTGTQASGKVATRAMRAHGKTPDWVRIHALNFAKMESIDAYVTKKRMRLEEANWQLGLSSPALPAGGATMQAADLSKRAILPIIAKPAAVTTGGTGHVTNAIAMADRHLRRAQQQQAQTRRVRIIKPVARGNARNIGNTSRIPRAIPFFSCNLPAAISERVGTKVTPFSTPAAVGTSVLQSTSRSVTRPLASTDQNASISKKLGSALQPNSTLNSTYTVHASKLFDLQASLAKKPTWQPYTGPLRPADAYKKPVLKTRDDRRAEALAAKKDRRQGMQMAHRLLDSSDED